MNKIYTLLLAFSINFTFGQQIEQYSLYNMNNYLTNPAVGGSYSYWNVKVGARNQWVDLKDDSGNLNKSISPRTIFSSFHGPIGHPDMQKRVKRKRAHHGVGGYFYNDATGPLSYKGIYGSYSAFKELTNTTTISFGSSLGLKQFRVRTSDLYFVEDPVDDLIGTQNVATGLLPDLNLGIWLSGENYFAGFSGKQLLRNRLEIGTPSDLASNASRLANHFFLTGGYVLELQHDWAISPTVMIKMVKPAPIEIDLNLRLMYSDFFWAGISYRHNDAVSAMLEYVFDDRYEIGYAFDYTTSELQNFSRNTHEIIIGVRIPHKEKVLCPKKFW